MAEIQIFHSAHKSSIRNPVENRSSPRYCEADDVPACGIKSRGSHWKRVRPTARQPYFPGRRGGGWRQARILAANADRMPCSVGTAVMWRTCGGIFALCSGNAPFSCHDMPGDCPALFSHFYMVSSVKNPRFLTWWILIKGGTLQPLFVCFRKCQGALMPFLLSENTCSRCSKTAVFYNTKVYAKQ